MAEVPLELLEFISQDVDSHVLFETPPERRGSSVAIPIPRESLQPRTNTTMIWAVIGIALVAALFIASVVVLLS